MSLCVCLVQQWVKFTQSIETKTVFFTLHTVVRIHLDIVPSRQLRLCPNTAAADDDDDVGDNSMFVSVNWEKFLNRKNVLCKKI